MANISAAAWPSRSGNRTWSGRKKKRRLQLVLDGSAGIDAARSRGLPFDCRVDAMNYTIWMQAFPPEAVESRLLAEALCQTRPDAANSA